MQCDHLSRTRHARHPREHAVLKLLPDLSEGAPGLKANPRRHTTERIVELKTQVLGDLLGRNDPTVWRQLVPKFVEYPTNIGIQVLISKLDRPGGREPSADMSSFRSQRVDVRRRLGRLASSRGRNLGLAYCFSSS